MNLLSIIGHYYDGVKIIKDWVGDGGVIVSRQQSQSRANVCLECPKNVDTISFEKETAQAIKKIVELKSHLKLTCQGERRLKTCGACLCYLPTKVHIPLEYVLKHINPEEILTYPEACWIRKEFQSESTKSKT